MSPLRCRAAAAPRGRRPRHPGAPIAPALLAALALPLLLAGCGRRRPGASELSFEDLRDTVGLARGAPLVQSFEPYRLVGGSMRLRGRVGLPDGTRLQISVASASTGRRVAVVQVVIADHGFETAPLMGERGPLPADLYRFELVSHFNSAWQPDAVLRATDQGRALRGPGMLRGKTGEPAFFLREERRL